MVSRTNNTSLEYKKCAGKGCNRVGRIILKVRYLNKTGLFCDCCVNDLVASDLAIKVEDDSKREQLLTTQGSKEPVVESVGSTQRGWF
jgi:hypothetical protein